MGRAALTAGRPLNTIDDDFWTFFRNSHVALYLAAPDGALIDVNDACAKLLGADDSASVRRVRANIFDWRVTAEDRRAFAAMLEKNAPGQFIRSRIVTRTGREIAVEECASRTSATRIIGALSHPQAAFESAGEREAMERDLARAKLEVERANRFKSEFLANLSHELRTPLNGVIGGADIIASRDVDEATRQFAAVIRESGEHLLSVIDNILDLSKLESGHLAPNFETLALRDFKSELEERHRPIAEAKGLSFVVKTAQRAPDFIETDGCKLRRIVDIFLSNAVKFTHHGGVAFGVDVGRDSVGNDVLYFVVRDTGCGIADGEIDRVFTPYEQIDGSTTRRFGGVGIGLTLATRLAELIGGRISAASAEGEGSTFTLRLPLTAHEADASAPAADSVAAAPATQGDILIVDDISTNLLIAVQILKSLGFSCSTAATGAEAVERLRRGGVRAVLMDVSMPDMDGVAATAAIRALDGEASVTPIIALTANVFDGDRERYLQAGMNGYVSKPVNARTLKAELDRVLGA